MAAGSDGQGPISVSAQLRLVVEASARMAGTLDVRAVAAALAGTVVPVFADRARVDLVSAVLRPGHEVADSDARLMSQVTDVNAVSTDGARPDGAEDWKAYLVSSGAGQALATGRARVGAGPDDSSLLWVPLAARGRVLGLVTLSRGTGSAPYSAGDAAFAAELGTRAALAFDNLRLYDEARVTALALQRSLLPTTRPHITGVEMAHRYLAGSRDTEVGGDWFDVLPLSCGRVAFVIGDVMGRGLRAAAAMGQLRTAVRTLAVLDVMPEELLEHLDHLAASTEEVQLATCVYAVFDPVSRELCYATAGHPPVALVDPDGRARFLSAPSGAPLGVGGVPFEASSVEVEDGSRLLLYTDGLVESRDTDIDTGLARLARALTEGPTELEALCDHLLEALGRTDGHTDDVALLLARLRGLDRGRVASWSLHGRGTEIARVRAHVRSALEGWGLTAMVATGELLVSELATNAVLHGRPPIELQVLLLDDLVTFSVTDAEPPLPRFRRSSEYDEGGRGLQLVATLARRWGARSTPDGKVVWCELARP